MGGTLSQIGLMKLDAASVHLTKFELDRAISYWRLTLGSKAMLNRTDFSKLFMRPVAKKSIRQNEEKRIQDMYETFCRYESHCRPLSPHCSHSNPSTLVHCTFFVRGSPACENIAAVYLFLGLVVFSLHSDAKDKLQGNIYPTLKPMVILTVQHYLSCFSDIWAV